MSVYDCTVKYPLSIIIREPNLNFLGTTIDTTSFLILVPENKKKMKPVEFAII